VQRQSDQPIRPGRCATRMCRIDRLTVATEVDENTLNDCRRLDARDNAQPPAAVSAGLDVYGEHPLEALRPGHCPLRVDGRWLVVLAASGGACLRHDPRPVRARRRKHTVVPRQVRAGFWHQRGESGDKVFGLEDHVGGAVTIRRLQRIANVPAPGQRQPAGGDRRSCDVTCEALELVALRGLRRQTGVQRKAGAFGDLRPRCVRFGRQRLQGEP